MHPDIRIKLIKVLADGKPVAFREGEKGISSDFIYCPDVSFSDEELFKIGKCYDGREILMDATGETKIGEAQVFQKSKLIEELGIPESRAKFLTQGRNENYAEQARTGGTVQAMR